jgi:spermidine synthase
VDLFTCGDTVEPWVSFDHLKKVFGATNHSALEMYRGNINLLNRTDFQIVEHGGAKQPSPKYSRTLWFTDRDDNQALSLRYTGDCLFNQRSEFQSVRVFETSAYGKMLAIDSCVMATERDEMHYHEMLVHPALQLHGSPENILVIGGGDGGTIREVFKYKEVKFVTMVEIDELVVKASNQFFPSLSKEFKNPKLKLIFDDGIKFVKNAQPEHYDVIIVDGADPRGPAEGLFTKDFYLSCKAALKPGGIVVAQGESPMFQEKAFVALHQRLREVFGETNAHVGLFFAPTYPSGMWSIQIAKKGNLHPTRDLNVEKADHFAKEHQLHYYESEVHKGAFALPRFVQKMLKG